MLGLSTLKALRSIEAGDAKLSVASQLVDLPRRTDSAERIAELEQERRHCSRR